MDSPAEDPVRLTIAILDWALCAALAREAELIRRARAVLGSSDLPATATRRGAGADDTKRVGWRRLAALQELLQELDAAPASDLRLRLRLESARFEARQGGSG